MNKLFSSQNKQVTTISNCSDEPIHIPGSIQPHGFLLVINSENKQLALCSANTADFLVHPPAYFLSKHFKEVLPPALCDLLEHFSPGNPEANITPVTINLYNNIFECFRRISGTFIYLECIITTDLANDAYGLFSKTNALLKATDKKTTLQELCSLVALNIREVIGFDRIMIYKFDEMYNGHVYAESLSENVDSYLGLHYPHTDIPQQARDLYLKNPLRLIPDIYYEAVPIVTLEEQYANPALTDLSDVQLRSVSPIHIQYLKNMGIGASMSISLIRDGKLWGLIACHNHTAKNPSYVHQVQAYLLTQILSSQITVQETAEEYRLSVTLDIPLKNLMEFLKREENFIELHFEKLKEITEIVHATGAALLYKNKIYTNGNVPSEAFIFSLYNWLSEYAQGAYYTQELQKDFPAANVEKDWASGLLYQQLSKESGMALLWFRPSAEKVVSWAGRPDNKEALTPLTPRNSFEAWQEIKKGISNEWTLPELNTAFRFSYLLKQHISHLLQREEELRSRKLNEQLLRANKELENINWISTHDLKEPLRKIQIFATMIDANKDLPKVDNLRLSIDKIRLSALRMQEFIDDLLRYSKMSGAEMIYEKIDLNEIISFITKDFKEEKAQGIFEIMYESLPSINASRFQVQQLFLNLTDNAVKFKKEGQPSVINITYELVNDTAIANNEKSAWHKITVRDNGIGLTETMSNSIFDIFKRGHSNETYKGTGVGLSICRKIMENHGGRIIASGKENVGASFHLYFPVS